MSSNDEIGDIFRKRFENEESPVSNRVWENIKNALPPEKPRKRFPFYWAGILFLAGMLSLSGIYFYSKNSGSYSPVAAKPNPAEHESVALAKKHEENDSFTQTNTKNPDASIESFQSLDESDGFNNINKKKDGNFDVSSNRKNSDIEKNKTNRSFEKETAKSKHLYERSGNGEKHYRKTIQLKNTKKEDPEFLAVADNRYKRDHNKNKTEQLVEKDGKETTQNKINTENGNSINYSGSNTDNKSNDSSHITKEYSEEETEKNETQNQDLNMDLVLTDSYDTEPDYKSKTESTEQTEGKASTETIINSENVNKTEKEKSNGTTGLLMAKGDPISLSGRNSVNDSSETNQSIEDSTEVQKEEKATDSLKADEDGKKEEKKENLIKFSVDLFGTPAITYRSLSANTDDGLKNRNEYEHSRFNAGGGIRINYGISSKVSFSGGLGIFSYGEKYDYQKEEITHFTTYQYDTIWIQDSPSNSYYYVTKDSVKTERRVQHEYSGKSFYRYMEIPFSVTYMFKTGKLGVGIRGGISFNMLLKAYTVRIGEISAGMASAPVIEEYSGKNSPFKPVTFGGFINPTITYNLMKNWVLFTEPGYKFLLSSVYKKQENISLKPYGLNVNIGVRYIFN